MNLVGIGQGCFNRANDAERLSVCHHGILSYCCCCSYSRSNHPGVAGEKTARLDTLLVYPTIVVAILLLYCTNNPGGAEGVSHNLFNLLLCFAQSHSNPHALTLRPNGTAAYPVLVLKDHTPECGLLISNYLCITGQ
jgi:hypothetical protein